MLVSIYALSLSLSLNGLEVDHKERLVVKVNIGTCERQGWDQEHEFGANFTGLYSPKNMTLIGFGYIVPRAEKN